MLKLLAGSLLCLSAWAVCDGAMAQRAQRAQRAQGEQGGPPAGQIAAGKELLESGRMAEKQRRYAEALSDYEQALARLREPEIYVLIGDMAARIGDNAKALGAYREYLAQQPGAKSRPEIEARIASLEGGSGGADLSPAAAASTQAASAQAATAGPRETPRGHGPWWLWTGIGVAVVATVVAAIVVASSDESAQPAQRGDVGGTIQTLEVP